MALAFAAIWNINAQSAQSAQERFEAFRRRANADYERFRTEALNSYADFLEQAWQDYEVVAGRRPYETPKPQVLATISEEEKAALKVDGQVYQIFEVKPDTTNAWFSNLQWDGSRLERVVERSVDQLRSVSVKMSTSVMTLSDIAKERRRAIAERLKKIGSISEDYVAPSELRRLKKEAELNKLLVDNTSKTADQPNEIQTNSPRTGSKVQSVKSQSVQNASQKEQQKTAQGKDTPSQSVVVQPATPVVVAQEPVVPVVEEYPTIDFELYGLDIAITEPSIDPQAISDVAMSQQVAAYWRKINKANLNTVIDELTEISLFYNLGDWCTFKAVEQYAAKWAGEHEAAKHIMMQYLLLNMGYDVRLAISKSNSKVILLLPVEQTLCDSPYIPMGDKNYYLYPIAQGGFELLTSCTLPKELVCNQINMVNNDPIVLPRDNKPFTVEYGDLHVTGNLNMNIIRMQQEYPLMETPCYASSMHDERVHLTIVEQLKEQLKGLSEQDAANAILQLVENGFNYKTDGDQFGNEKPFFFEEILYHPYCDCEDRSIFFSYLVKQVLGLDVVLVHFPNHACTAVAFNQPPTSYNVSYKYKGKRYYICDPCYVISDVGMCMPSYANIDPVFWEWYHIEEVKM